MMGAEMRRKQPPAAVVRTAHGDPLPGDDRPEDDAEPEPGYQVACHRCEQPGPVRATPDDARAAALEGGFRRDGPGRWVCPACRLFEGLAAQKPIRVD
jgi:hypothetical protein